MENVDIVSFLKRTADKSGFVRSQYMDERVPLSVSDLTAMWCFGDMRSNCILSSLLLRRYREQVRGSKYFILCGWPGYEGLFPYVDEYWAIKDGQVAQSMYSCCDGFNNTSPLIASHVRGLNYFLEDVIDYDNLKTYYDNGIKQEFWEKFKHVKRFMPSIPSVAIMGKGIVRELESVDQQKVFLHPAKHVRRWSQGRVSQIPAPREFWMRLCERIVEEGMVPVIWNNVDAHDLSNDLLGKCIFTSEKDISKILALMRHTGCVLDIFNGLSRLAITARTPFVACDERSRYAGCGEHEIDGLCCDTALPREYIFSFSTIIKPENYGLWAVSLFDSIINKLKTLIGDTNRDTLPATSESYVIVPYEKVRAAKKNRMGIQFIKIDKG